MDKCLVTKLGNTVSGNFPKLGELIIPITTVGLTPSTGDFVYFTGTDVAIELRDGIKFAGYGDGTAIDQSSDDAISGANSYANRKYFNAEQTGNLVIQNKYNLTNFYLASENSCKFVSEVDIKEIAFSSNLSAISAVGNKLKGDISCLAGKKVTSRLRLDKNPNLTGDIVALAATFHKAVQSSLTMNNTVLDKTNVSGSVENLIQAVRALGSTTSDGSGFILGLGQTQATFNGQPISASSKIVSWTETTITYNGVTITDVTNNA